MENKEPAYYAIIPANVRYNDNICANAKLLYGEITALCNQKGYCWSGNEYFAKLYKVTIKTASRWISELENEGYIKRVLVYKEGSKEVSQRKIYLKGEGIDEKVEGYGQKKGEGILKKEEDNTTSFNNKINNTKDIDLSIHKYIIDRLNELANTNFRHTTKSTIESINAKLRDGYKIEDIIHVIEVKCEEWLNTDFEKNLNPTTLLRPNNFERYVNQKKKAQKNKLFNPWEVQDGRESNQTNLFDNSGSIPTTVKQIGFRDVL